MLRVRIPQDDFYTLYARGNIVRKVTVPEDGTYIRFDGVVLLYYKYPHYRRAYIVRNHDELTHYPAVTLPNVIDKVGILQQVTGRRIDLLRTAYWNLELINGKPVYTWATKFWQDFGCLLDNFNGYKSAAIKSNLIQLSREYALNKKYQENSGKNTYWKALES